MAQMTKTFLTTQQFLALGSQIAGARSKLSPLSTGSAQQAVSARARVLNPELVTEDGHLRPELVPLFRTLDSAQSFCVVGYAGRGGSYEMASYYHGQAASPDGVSLTYLGDGLQMQSPPVENETFELMRQFVGDTLLKHVEIEMDLPILDAWLLFGVVDAGRRKALEGLLSEAGSAADELTAEEIHAGLESKKTGLQWLAPYFDACLSLATPTRKEIDTGLNRLISKGLLTLLGANYLPGELVQQLIAGFLLVDGHIRIRAAALDRAGEAVSTDVRAIQGRSGSILLWSHDASSVNLWGASPAQLLTLIGSLMQNPGQATQPVDKGSSSAMPPRRPQVAPPPEKL